MSLNFGEYSVRISNNRPDLVKKRYDESGLKIKDSITSSSLVIECLRNSKIIGSVTVDLGNYQDFFAYDSYPEKLKEFQEKNSRMAEITKLAIEQGEETRMVMGLMFNMIYRLCVIKNGITHFIVECKKNHVAGYKRLLKFELADGPKYNPIAQGEACLLVLDINKVTN
jgi:hypothetical protein